VAVLNLKLLLSVFLVGIISFAFAQTHAANKQKVVENNLKSKKFEITKTEAEWKKILSSEAFHILREAGTEAPFTGKYYNNHEKGTYYCAACDLPLFSSAHKFESGTGWPSFYQPIEKNKVITESDFTYGMKRTEVLCARCGGHLGHVFDDGPEPTGLRYCINSAALVFKKAEK
jgi:peptide-methionine (R)-S-oxide reductase